MSEKPILFNGEMVRAIIDGRKTQTRRVVNPQLMNGWEFDGVYGKITSLNHPKRDRFGAFIKRVTDGFRESDIVVSPYGDTADRLWVRETFQAQSVTGQWWNEVPREERELHNWAWTNPVYPAYSVEPPRWLPSIHMPKDACRLFLDITDVRIERVKDISTEDALAEGIERHPQWTPRAQFSMLWDSINDKRGYGWDVNPFVWVVEFKVLDGESND